MFEWFLNAPLPKTASFKVGLSTSKKSPLKLMKNAFYFNLKTLFVLSRYLNFCLVFLFMQKKQLDQQKDMVNFKIYDVVIWLTNNSTHILPSISRSKSNQTMKFGHLKEYNKRNTFLQKSCRTLGRGNQFQTPFCFLKKLYMKQKQVVYSLVFSIALNLAYNKKNCIRLQIINPEIRSILIFKKSVREQILHHILSMIF